MRLLLGPAGSGKTFRCLTELRHALAASAEGAPLLREWAFAGRLEEAALLQTGMVMRFFTSRAWPVSPNYYRIYQELADRLHFNDPFA